MSQLHLIASVLLAGMLAAACGQAPTATTDTAASVESEAATRAAYEGGLPAKMDCVREAGGVLVAAHRGGPAPGYPENAIETLQYALDAGAPVMEIDVAESRDGVLFLMHDRSLTRTTTGEGPVADTGWDEISRLRLVDNEGRVTAFAPPKLSDALEWAVRTGAILELDRKETTSFRNIIDEVRAAGAGENVLIITYSDQEAWQVAELAPGLMMTAGVGDRAHEASLLEGGVNAEHLIAWTGTRRPSPGKWRGLASKDIESAFGTLGRPGERLDDIYWQDGDPSEYVSLVENGLAMIATDEPYRLLGPDGLPPAMLDKATSCLS
ncbi:glycerophosphodiester phosphodiesterase family protein [Henriciella marina]|uniref:glycerophosphodiester phosphodiesterase family protein n=1 Tax=Henriciella marina TaxID=453851 RepID=UPI001F1B348A|nr:glycerophosphodiester phosphodiesterase family protein [Henriciella marina]